MKKINFILNNKLVQVELTDEIFTNEVFTEEDGFKIAKILIEPGNTREIFYSWVRPTESVDNIFSCRVNFKTEDGMADCPMNNRDTERTFFASDQFKDYLKDKRFEDIHDLLLM